MGGLSKLFCRQAAGAVVVADLTDQDTLENAVRWKEQLDTLSNTDSNQSKMPVLLLANKYDLIKEYEEENKEIEDYMQE